MKILRIIGVLLVILVVIVAAFYLTGHGGDLIGIAKRIGGFFGGIWHWIVGLFGLIIGLFKRIGEFFGASKSEKEIRAENESIKRELQDIRQQTKTTSEILAKDREIYEAKRSEYETKIAATTEHAQKLKTAIAGMKDQGYENYINSLDPLEKEQFEKTIHKDVVEIGTAIRFEKQFPAITRKEASRVLTSEQIKKSAETLGVEPAAMRAVIEVESSGGGFLDDGRPKILFEGHIFWQRLLRRKIDPAPLAKKHPDIVYPKWVKTFYQRGAGEHERLERAKAIHEAAALESASWGLFQIMGMNYLSAGFGSVLKFVEAHEDSEEKHLEAFCNFIKNEKILPFLINKEWKDFAGRYNGPGQVPVYQKLLEDAYQKWKAKQGTT